MHSSVHGVLELRHVTPRRLLDVEAEMDRRLSPGSVSSYIATLRAAFSWAASQGLMPVLPKRMPDPIDYELPAMRLAPITQESLERMEAAAVRVVGRRHAASIQEYLRCLWLSGCRLMEPLDMHAFRHDKHRPIGLNSPAPMFAWVNTQKNRRDQIARITLDFARWLAPLVEQREWLFQPTCEHGPITTGSRLSSIISEIGERAKVIAEPGETPKFATAKHFRSSFVTRWSQRGMSIEQIQAIVRHASRVTTEKYYLAPIEPVAIAEFAEADWIPAVEPRHEQYQRGMTERETIGNET
ncbi:tyrosine-type recombinase/integrase [Roseiconus nitratireducens]|nr:site-specific integrase [Roseiconus nitratireducens]